jgi:hypothetical protein
MREAVVNFLGGWMHARVVFNSARGSRRGNFGAQDGAKARAAKKLVPVAFLHVR